MEFLSSKILFCCILVLLLVACPARGQCDNTGFSYDEESPIGPSHWGDIKTEWRTCSDGKMQSPIDILDYKAAVWSPELGKLDRHYKFSSATLVNRGYYIELEWVDGGGQIQINGTLFHLKRCHWHAPSEHLINGRSYDLDIHLVHEVEDGRTAVIGMVYEIGPPDPFLFAIELHIELLADTMCVERNIGFLDPKWINIGSWEYYRYMGSLTTPPCSENIIWMVVRKVNTVSRRQVEFIRRAIHDESKTNARPVQPLNNRLIQLYKAIPRDHMGDIV